MMLSIILLVHATRCGAHREALPIKAYFCHRVPFSLRVRSTDMFRCELINSSLEA